MSDILLRLVYLSLAGAMGTLARYGVTLLLRQYSLLGLPWGTWGVNIIGCFAFGFFFNYLKHAPQVDELRLIFLLGFLGAFTTFSAYIFELVTMFQNQQYGLLALNLMGQNVIGFLALLLGLVCADFLQQKNYFSLF